MPIRSIPQIRYHITPCRLAGRPAITPLIVVSLPTASALAVAVHRGGFVSLIVAPYIGRGHPAHR